MPRSLLDERYEPEKRVHRLTGRVKLTPSTKRKGRWARHPKNDPGPSVDYIEGAQWWLARSERNRASLLAAFRSENVPCYLLERVGSYFDVGVIKRGKHKGQYLIMIQLIRVGVDQSYWREDDYGLDLCLSEEGIVLQEEVDDV